MLGKKDTELLDPSNGENPYPLSTSREWGEESQTYYYRYRQYNPSIGKFMRRDPIGYSGRLNLYSYAINNPIRFIDLSGYIVVWGPRTCEKKRYLLC